MLAEFSIYPTHTEHMSKDVARFVEVLQSAGLEYRLGPMSTAVEGSLEQILEAIRCCHQAVAQQHDRVLITVTLDDRKHEAHHLADMVTSVEQELGHRVPRALMDSQC